MKIPSIPAKKFSEQIHRDPGSFVLVDVRNEWEYNDLSIIKERISIYVFPYKLNVLKKYDDKKIVLCCLTGERGNIGAKYLLSQGFKNVYNLLGGFEALMEIEGFQK